MAQSTRNKAIVLKKIVTSFLFLVILSCQVAFSQRTINNFLKPSDTLNKSRFNTFVISEVAVASATLIGLNKVWYADYPKSSFHFVNDNAEWLQMDKVGHVFSTYHLSAFGANALKWSGAKRKEQLVYGSAIGLGFMSVVEIFDGHSQKWGASLGDVLANVSGSVLFVSQELLWKEQRIIPKFSFHATPFASARPNILGDSYSEQILKDYNGQTYWLSANLFLFTKSSKVPKWVNLAIGYGAEGMITGNDDFVNTVFLPGDKRFRQIYLSLDVDLTKIKSKSHFIKTLFSVVNAIKIPAPTIEFRESGTVKFHLFYF